MTRKNDRINWFLNVGHGGIAFGHYFTAGKRSPEVPPGIYEGEWNRDICTRTHKLHKNSSLILNPGPINIPLKTQVQFVNQVHKKLKNCALLSIHANAGAKKGWSKAKGHVVFVPRYPSEDEMFIANAIRRELVAVGYTRDRGIKKRNFQIINSINCPGVLIEAGFMTNREEVELLQRVNMKSSIAAALRNAMTQYEDWVVER